MENQNIVELRNEIYQLRESNYLLDKKVKVLKEQLENAENSVSRLEEEIMKINRGFQIEREKILKQTEDSISKYKFQIESMQTRNETATYIERLNFAQNACIEDLEQELQKEKSQNNILFIKKQVEFQNKLCLKNKKTMDQISNMKKESEKAVNDNLLSNNKLTLLMNQELVNELKYSTSQIESLIKIKAENEKEIQGLKSDIVINNEINKLLKIRYSKLQNQLDIILKEKDSNCVKSNEKQSMNKTQTPFSLGLSTSKSFNFKGSRNSIRIENCVNFTKTQFEFNNLESRVKLLEKENKQIYEKYKTMKINCSISEEKFKEIERKYNNIFHVCEEAVNKLNDNKEKVTLDFFKNFELDRNNELIFSNLIHILWKLVTNEFKLDDRNPQDLNKKKFHIKLPIGKNSRNYFNLRKVPENMKIFEKHSIDIFHSKTTRNDTKIMSNEKTSFLN